ncbi:MAG: hypothetical protein J7605_04745 [Variovorax sp.]|nr:hypothetical protein [Variovorax sp.]
MKKRVLALGLDPAFVDSARMGNFTPELVRAFIEQQIDQIRALGFEVESCLVDAGDTAEAEVERLLRSHGFDCVMFGAGLRDEDRLMLFEKLLNLAHRLAPQAAICFNTNPEDSAEAVLRWVSP